MNPDLHAIVGAACAIPFARREPGRYRRIGGDDCSRIARRGLHIDASTRGIANTSHEVGKLKRDAIAARMKDEIEDMYRVKQAV